MSPFFGRRLPNLVGRFTNGLPSTYLGNSAYGATPGGAAPLLPVAGGQDFASIEHNHGLSSVPPHSHGINADGDHDHSSRTGYGVEPIEVPGSEPVPGGVTNPATELGFANPRNHRHQIPSGGSHAHGGSTTSTTVAPGSSASTDSYGGQIDNRPAFVGLLKIIRVR